MALLDKQGWRLLHDSDSLLFKIIRAKLYFTIISMSGEALSQQRIFLFVVYGKLEMEKTLMYEQIYGIHQAWRFLVLNLLNYYP